MTPSPTRVFEGGYRGADLERLNEGTSPVTAGIVTPPLMLLGLPAQVDLPTTDPENIMSGLVDALILPTSIRVTGAAFYRMNPGTEIELNLYEMDIPESPSSPTMTPIFGDPLVMAEGSPFVTAHGAAEYPWSGGAQGLRYFEPEVSELPGLDLLALIATSADADAGGGLRAMVRFEEELTYTPPE